MITAIIVILAVICIGLGWYCDFLIGEIKCIQERLNLVSYSNQQMLKDIFDRGMIVCPDCGNKRCPKASDPRLACTGSNEPGQAGSDYE